MVLPKPVTEYSLQILGREDNAERLARENGVVVRRRFDDRGWSGRASDRGNRHSPYINTTSTRECTFRPGFAGESVRVLMYVGMKIQPEQRLAA